MLGIKNIEALFGWLIVLALIAGCQNTTNSHLETSSRPGESTAYERKATSVDSQYRPNPKSITLDNRDAEIIRFVLSRRDDSTDRIYFLTTTPFQQWHKTGEWTTLPDSFHKSIAQLKTEYRPAKDAYLKNSSVFQKHTDAEAWMRWVKIIEWKSDSEVTIEDGVWCCPMGGGASTVTYEKIDGKWKFKEFGKSWVS